MFDNSPLTLGTTRRPEPKCVPQLFLGLLMGTPRSAIGQFFCVLRKGPKNLWESHLGRVPFALQKWRTDKFLSDRHSRMTVISLRASSPIGRTKQAARERASERQSWEGPPPNPRFHVSSRVLLARLLFTISPNGELARRLDDCNLQLCGVRMKRFYCTYPVNLFTFLHQVSPSPAAENAICVSDICL